MLPPPMALLVVGVLLYSGRINLDGARRKRTDPKEGVQSMTTTDTSSALVETDTPSGDSPSGGGVPPTPTPTPPILPPAAAKPKERSILGRLTIGLMLVGMGVLAILDNIPDIAIEPEPLKLSFGPWQPAQLLSRVRDRIGSKKRSLPISASADFTSGRFLSSAIFAFAAFFCFAIVCLYKCCWYTCVRCGILPDERVLATSRAPLRVDGERLWPVPPLSLPATGSPADHVSRSDAVQLFVERGLGLGGFLGGFRGSGPLPPNGEVGDGADEIDEHQEAPQQLGAADLLLRTAGDVDLGCSEQGDLDDGSADDLRQITDEVMFEIREMTGQTYHNAYAGERDDDTAPPAGKVGTVADEPAGEVDGSRELLEITGAGSATASMAASAS